MLALFAQEMSQRDWVDAVSSNGVWVLLIVLGLAGIGYPLPELNRNLMENWYR